MSLADANPGYWREYSNLQHVKHALIKNYLNGWFPKMLLGPHGCDRLFYLDTHAGRGKHLNGQLGSPLVALTTLLDHASRDRLLQSTEVRFVFIERDAANAAALSQELEAHALPPGVHASAKHGDSFRLIDDSVTDFEKGSGKLAPGFLFVDPYGFKLSGGLLRRLLNYPKVGLFVNVIWRELDMAIRQGQPDATSPLVPTLNSVFSGEDWRKIDAEDPDARADQCADLFREITGAKWGTRIRMLDNGRVRYFLLHLTRSDAGRDLMKECIWQACPDGGYYASKSDNPQQRILIEPEPNLEPLRQWVLERLAASPKRWQALSGDLREELWLEKQLNAQIRSLRNAGDVEADSYVGPFARTNDPLLRLRVRQPSLF